MLEKENQVETFNRCLNNILNPYERTEKEKFISFKKLAISLLEIGLSIEKISETSKISILEIEKIKKENNL